MGITQHFYRFGVRFRGFRHYFFRGWKNGGTSGQNDEGGRNCRLCVFGATGIMRAGEDFRFTGGFSQDFRKSRNIISQSATPGGRLCLGPPKGAVGCFVQLLTMSLGGCGETFGK